MSNISSMRGGRSRKFKSEINVVPYIDVMLVLLVIFMVVAPLTMPFNINLPSADVHDQPPAKRVDIEIHRDGTATVGVHGDKQKPVKLDELGRHLRSLHQQHPDLPAIVAADEELKFGVVVSAISEAKLAGIKQVGILTQTLPNKR